MKQKSSSASDNLVALHNWMKDACAKGAVPVIAGMNGDMDTIGSAISLAASNQNMMACGLHLGRISKRVCQKLGAPFRKISNASDLPNKLGGIIIVDAASFIPIPPGSPEIIPAIPEIKYIYIALPIDIV